MADPVTIQVDLYKEIMGLPKDKRKDLLDSLSTESDIIENVASQILYGSTELGSCGMRDGPVDLWTTAYPSPLTVARRHLLTHADAFMAKESAEVAGAAVRERERHSEKEREYFDELVKLRNTNRRLQDEITELRRIEHG